MLPRRFSPKVTLHIDPSWNDPQQSHNGVAACLSWKMPTQRAYVERNETPTGREYFVQKFDQHLDYDSIPCSDRNTKKLNNVSYRAAGFKMNKNPRKGIDEDILLDAIHQHQLEKDHMNNLELRRLASKYRNDSEKEKVGYDNRYKSIVRKPSQPIRKPFESVVKKQNEFMRKPFERSNMNADVIAKERSIYKINKAIHNDFNSGYPRTNPLEARPKMITKKDLHTNLEKSLYYDRANEELLYEHYDSDDDMIITSPRWIPVNEDKYYSNVYPESRRAYVHNELKNTPKTPKSAMKLNRHDVTFNAFNEIIPGRKTPEIYSDKFLTDGQFSDKISMDISWKDPPTFYNGYAKVNDKKMNKSAMKNDKLSKEQTHNLDHQQVKVKVEGPSNPSSVITVQLNTPRGTHGRKYVLDKLINY